MYWFISNIDLLRKLLGRMNSQYEPIEDNVLSEEPRNVSTNNLNIKDNHRGQMADQLSHGESELEGEHKNAQQSSEGGRG